MDCLPEVFDPNSVGFHELKSCEICEIVFSLTQRRHHCRRCGKSVCNKCSANMKPLSRQDAKTMYRVCDACDTEIENFKVLRHPYPIFCSLQLRKNHDEILRTQSDMIEVLKVSIETADQKKALLREDYERQKVKMQEELEKKIKKREDMEHDVDSLRKELQRLNDMRNNLYSVINSEERVLKEKEQEKNKLIVQKSAKLQDLADKEKLLHEKESKNEDLRRLVDAQKQKVKKAQLAASNQEDEEKKHATCINNQEGLLDDSKGSGNNVKSSLAAAEVLSPQLLEERNRLDKLRSDKFKFIMDAMASHAIEEHGSECSASFISMDGRQIRQNSNAAAAQNYHHANNNTVLEVDEASEGSSIKHNPSRMDNTYNRHQQMAQRIQLEMNQEE